MSFLSDFPKEEMEVIISLPYRIAHWISHIDDLDKTKRDDKWEAAAMDKAIKRLARLHTKGSFAGEVMMQIDKNRLYWNDWKLQSQEENILTDVQKVQESLTKTLAEKELMQYKKALWYIGIVVAQAYKEDQDPDQEMMFDNFFNGIKEKLFPTKLASTPENMSKDEKIALKKLRTALKG